MDIPRLSAKEAFVLQLLISEGELHGLGIVKADGSPISRGSVYHTLGRMEERGFLESRLEDPGKYPGNPRRLYRAVGNGAYALNLHRAMQNAAQAFARKALA